MKIKNIICTLTILGLLLSCSSSSNDDIIDNQETQEPEQEEITEMTPENEQENTNKLTYNANIKSIIDGACIRCHGTTLTNGAPFPLVNFDQVSSRVGRIISRVNSTSRPMPPNGRIEMSLRAQIEQWNTDGLLEN